MNPTQYAHARSASPLFDELAARIPARDRPLAPITTSSRFSDRATVPTASAHQDTPAAPAPRRSHRATGVPQPSVASLVREPLTTGDLTAEEKAIVDEMGGTVARLILKMLNDDTKATRRWPFHPVA